MSIYELTKWSFCQFQVESLYIIDKMIIVSMSKTRSRKLKVYISINLMIILLISSLQVKVCIWLTESIYESTKWSSCQFQVEILYMSRQNDHFVSLWENKLKAYIWVDKMIILSISERTNWKPVYDRQNDHFVDLWENKLKACIWSTKWSFCRFMRK